MGTELYGKTLGIVGAGKIGYLTARRAMAFGMKVLAYDPFLSQDNILLSEIQAELVELDDLLARADVVSCHLPATPQTVGLLNRERFFRMKPGALFINTSRGKVVVGVGLAGSAESGNRGRSCAGRAGKGTAANWRTGKAAERDSARRISRLLRTRRRIA